MHSAYSTARAPKETVRIIEWSDSRCADNRCSTVTTKTSQVSLSPAAWRALSAQRSAAFRSSGRAVSIHHYGGSNFEDNLYARIALPVPFFLATFEGEEAKG